MVVRTADLKKLEQLYKSDKDQMILMYGTRVSGGRDLMRQFTRDKEFFYTVVPDTKADEQKKHFMADAANRFVITVKDEDSYLDVLSRMRSNSGERLVIIVDDFQNAVKQGTSLLKDLSDAKINSAFKSKVMIVLMVNELSHMLSDPDYIVAKGIDERIMLGEVPFLDIVRAFPGYSVKEAVRCYGILGGNSDFINAWNKKLSVRDNVINTMLSPRGILFNGARDFLSSELRELSGYQAILSSISRGNEKLNDLYKDTGYSRAKLIVYMKNLEAMDAVEKVVSFETGNSGDTKKGIYRIKNQYLNFYYRFIYPNISMLYSMEPGEFYDKYIAKELESYLKETFIKVCTEYLVILNMMGKTPFKFDKAGTWLGKSGTIDVLAQNDARYSIVAKTNYDKPLFPYSDYEELLSNMIRSRIKAEAVYLFSATEFDPKLVELSKQEDSHLILIDMKEL